MKLVLKIIGTLINYLMIFSIDIIRFIKMIKYKKMTSRNKVQGRFDLPKNDSINNN